eukprot:15481856-Alexandrium_andersonii.AAC.1
MARMPRRLSLLRCLCCRPLAVPWSPCFHPAGGSRIFATVGGSAIGFSQRGHLGQGSCQACPPKRRAGG